MVSSDYHRRRTRWVFRRVLKQQFENVYFVSARTDGISPRQWWQSELGLRTYLAENCKLVLCRARYGETIFCTLVFRACVMAVLVPRRKK